MLKTRKTQCHQHENNILESFDYLPFSLLINLSKNSRWGPKFSLFSRHDSSVVVTTGLIYVLQIYWITK